ncbi:MAG: hypothetical protein AB1805_16005 [Nitrospirota bacterium]
MKRSALPYAAVPQPHYGLLAGAFLLIALTLHQAGTAVLFAAGWNLSPLPVFFAVCAAVLIVWRQLALFPREKRIAAFSALLLTNALIVALALALSGAFYDLSFDGQNYHQEAIIELARGWNPLHAELSNNDHALWINHYAKGPWIGAAALSQLTGTIEYGKAMNILLLAASMMTCYAALAAMTRIGPEKAVPLSILFACNPVALTQLLSFYVDGQLYSVLLMFLSLAYFAFTKPQGIVMLMLAFSTIMAVTIKFTGLVYIAVLGAGVFAGFLLSGRAAAGTRFLAYVALGTLVGVLLVGFNPYVTNFLKKGHPFYPLAGKEPVDIIKPNTPGNLLSRSRVEALALSVFSRSENATAAKAATIKMPFTVAFSELKAHRGADTRVGGFGPFYSGMLVVALLIVMVAFRHNAKKTAAAVAGGALILASALVNPAPWWARYVPQLWMLPLIPLVLAHHLHGSRLLRVLPVLLVLSAAADVALVAGPYCYAQYRDSRALDRQLLSIAESAKPVVVDFNSFRSNRLRLERYGIRYHEVDAAPCGPRIRLVGSGTELCVPGNIPRGTAL